MNVWIKCSERMPPEHDRIMFHWGNDVLCGFLIGNDFCNELEQDAYGCRYYYPISEVTHWMPLPEPPIAIAKEMEK